MTTYDEETESGESWWSKPISKYDLMLTTFVAVCLLVCFYFYNNRVLSTEGQVIDRIYAGQHLAEQMGRCLIFVEPNRSTEAGTPITVCPIYPTPTWEITK